MRTESNVQKCHINVLLIIINTVKKVLRVFVYCIQSICKLQVIDISQYVQNDLPERKALPGFIIGKLEVLAL